MAFRMKNTKDTQNLPEVKAQPIPPKKRVDTRKYNTLPTGNLFVNQYNDTFIPNDGKDSYLSEEIIYDSGTGQWKIMKIKPIERTEES